MVHVVTPPPADVSRNDIIWLAGPRLIGILFNWSLLGVLTTQVYIYYLNFPKDLKWHKVLVYIVYLLDWAQTCSATYDAFHCVIAAIVQVTTNLIYRLGTRTRYGTWLCLPPFAVFPNLPSLTSYFLLLALLQLGGGIAVGIFVWRDSSEVARSDGLVSAVGVRLAGSAFADTVIAISMTYFLLRSKSQVMGHMNNVVTRLIRLTIETGTMTAIAAIVDLVFFLKATNGLHQVSGVILCKLYSNSLLVLFNNRMIVTSSKKDQTHFLSNSSGTNTSEGESSRELETFKAAVPRVSTLDLDGGISVSTKGEWRSRSQIEAIPLDDFT
ncbi:hypothetical protein LENED_004381 [Lentinula edodes]|uniref:DUF6534 domain-containing protein n=1 Tax=Lentinula edodes TaxID=5353 RepID=A0A1Q3E628_LENED|nr:hypothetical protein LENED_004381 [Lentinula edodes]